MKNQAVADKTAKTQAKNILHMHFAGDIIFCKEHLCTKVCFDKRRKPMYMLEIQNLFTSIKNILTEYEDGLNRIEQEAERKQIEAGSVNDDKQTEFVKMEKMLDAAFRIVMDTNSSSMPMQTEDVEAIPFNQLVLSRHIYACNNTDSDNSRAVSEILSLIKGQFSYV